jgi:hypothetical protein
LLLLLLMAKLRRCRSDTAVPVIAVVVAVVWEGARWVDIDLVCGCAFPLEFCELWLRCSA